MTAATKLRYHTPTVSVDADVSLDEFDISDIIKYLNHLGYQVGGIESTDSGSSEGIYLSPDDLNRIMTLAVCGQVQYAREFALGIIGDAIGVKL